MQIETASRTSICSAKLKPYSSYHSSPPNFTY